MIYLPVLCSKIEMGMVVLISSKEKFAGDVTFMYM